MDKAPIFINVDLEFLIKKTDRCKNKPEKSSTRKVGEHIPSNLSMSTMYHSKLSKRSFMKVDLMKNFCESLREHRMKIIKH